MKKLQIIRIQDSEDDTYFGLGYGSKEDRRWCHKVIDESPNLTLEELAYFCDMNAENRNAHDFVQVHILLAGLLLKTIGRKLATKIMRDIAERGGLDGMNGICGFDRYDSFKEFGIKRGIDSSPDFKFNFKD